ncbi:MAG: efflux RND transporter permease subunit [Bdellovibrionota bacterium]
MSLADLSIKRPIFISSIVIVMLAMGYMALKRLPVDLFPNVTFPVVTVSTVYRGAGPSEIETLISKVLEEEMSSIPGIKGLRSKSSDSLSQVIAEFTLETDLEYAEQQVRDRVSLAKRKLPKDIDEPIVKRIDPSDQPVLILAVQADLAPAELYDFVNLKVKPIMEQVPQVGMVQIEGGRKREIHVDLDLKKLKRMEMSATAVSARISAAGQNIPAGKVSRSDSELVFRTLGEFQNVKDVGSVIVSFFGNDVPVTVGQIADIKESLEDENSRSYHNGESSIFVKVFRQSGANTLKVADAVRKKTSEINKNFSSYGANGSIKIVRDGSHLIQANVDDVNEAIIIGIILTIFVVFFFLGSARSTFITGLALPNSLLGAFFLMWICGFSINIMTLLALSLAVGLLIDDAIVVRENIFRHVENGMSPIKAASVGTKEVQLAVLATTLAVIAVFGPIGFLQGVVGQFFKEFGLTVCFAMAISLFDALTIAPMLSAYFAGAPHGSKKEKENFFQAAISKSLKAFDDMQAYLEDVYEGALKWSLKKPGIVLCSATLIFLVSLYITKYIPKTFLPAQDTGEFVLSLELAPGTSLERMTEVSLEADKILAGLPEVKDRVLSIGGDKGTQNAEFYVNMVPRKERSMNTTQFKDALRKKLEPLAFAKPLVRDIDIIGAGLRPFNLYIVGPDLADIQKVADQVYAKMKDHPALVGVDTSYRPGKPEFQVQPDKVAAENLGVSTSVMGLELRNLVEGATPAVYRQNGEEYKIRVRLKEEDRDLKKNFNDIYVPNVNFSLVRLKNLAKPVEVSGPATIDRQDRGRSIQVMADIAAKGPGMGAAISDVHKFFAENQVLKPGMRYLFKGQAENFQELGPNMLLAAILGILFIFLVLASLYESFVTPLSIMLVLPLAACGAFFGLWIARESLNLFSMIGCVMLLGVATKNSILLVDATKQIIEHEGLSEEKALIKAGRLRLRPILMTSFALIAGMLPIAIGLNEASKQRTSMGWAVIGGLISSTVLTLLVVPAAYSYIERLRVFLGNFFKKTLMTPGNDS